MARIQDPVFRSFSKFTVGDGQTISVDLPRDLDYSAILLSFVGTPTFTGTATAKSMAPHALIRNISLVANGSKQLCNCSGVTAALKNRIASQNKNASFGFTATSGTPFYADTFIDQAIIDGIVPKDTQLPTRNLSSLQLAVTFNNLSDVMSGGSAYSFTGTLEVTLLNVKEYPAANGKFFVPGAVQYVSERTIPIARSETEYFHILTTDCLQRQFILYAMDAGVFADAITDVRIDRGNVTLARIGAKELQALNRRSQLDLTAAYGDGKVLVIDPTRYLGQGRAKLSDGWDMRTANGSAEQLYMYISYTGAANRSITVVQNYMQDYARFVR